MQISCGSVISYSGVYVGTWQDSQMPATQNILPLTIPVESTVYRLPYKHAQTRDDQGTEKEERPVASSFLHSVAQARQEHICRHSMEHNGTFMRGTEHARLTVVDIWRFPKIGVHPTPSIGIGSSLINHPFEGTRVPLIQEPPICPNRRRCRTGTGTMRWPDGRGPRTNLQDPSALVGDRKPFGLHICDLFQNMR